MYRLICGLIFILHSSAFAQWRSQSFSLREVEASGLAAVLKLDAGLSLQPILKNGNYTVYEFRKSNVVISGFQAVSYKQNGHLYCSWFVDQKARFETNSSTFISNHNKMWILNDSSGMYNINHYKDSAGYRWYFSTNNQHINRVDMRRYLDADTLVKARVFLPDPLSRANVFYGGIYRDRNDSTYAEIEAQMVDVDILCDYSNDSFRLKNSYLSFKELSKPVNPRATSKGAMLYTRNDQRFEEVNVYYHISELIKWLDSLGFKGYCDTVEMDVHAYEGADESAFDPLTSPPSIIFGGGGVDDAEDADVAIHEYIHAVFNRMIPNSYMGTQRQAIEEGVCFFLSVAYSCRYTLNQESQVYNWDGHNEFWNGRNLANNKIWPVNLTNQVHEDAQLFGGALYDLAREMGYDSTVKLVMQSLPLWVANINMRQGALIMWQVDSLLNGGRHHWPMIKAFFPRNLLPFLHESSPEFEPFILKNSESFATGTGNLFIHTPVSGELKIYNVAGKLVHSVWVEAGKEIELFHLGFQPGAYFIMLNGIAGKVLKF